MDYLFPPVLPASIPVQGRAAVFPVRRIYCVGRNYAEHAREMGALDQASGLEPPFFFSKPGDALVAGAGELAVAYPPMTSNLHHEVELVVALAAGGEDIPVAEALGKVFGYAVGLDLTRRDVQARAKEKGHPWDMGKGFEHSAVCGPLRSAAEIGHPASGRIHLEVNGQVRQAGDLAQMGWQVAQIIAELSRYVRLAAGDLIYTGTPSGVGPLQRGDMVYGEVSGVGCLRARLI